MTHPTVHAAFTASAARTPEAEFLCVEPVTAASYGIEAGSIRWREAAAEVDRLREAYARAGYGHGHRVGLLLENRPAFLYHWFALNALGVSVVPINAEMRAAELAYLIGHSGIELAVSLPQRADDLRAAAQREGATLDVMQASELEVPRARSRAPRADDPVGPHTECALLYTSGTTGRPKGCLLYTSPSPRDKRQSRMPSSA